MNKYLTKSRFILACQCPSKLFYTRKENEYASTHLENPFLEALADGGFQVGELAKCYYPDGHDILSLAPDKALKQTNELLEKNNVVIFEAAIKHKNLFIRVDILVKRGNFIKLYEVKAKSFDPSSDSFSQKKNKEKIADKWKPYLFDIAFQRHVVRSAFPDSTVTTYLYLVNKKSITPTDGLNQKFQIVEENNNRKSVKVTSPLSQDDLSEKLLTKIPVDHYCDLILNTEEGSDAHGTSFKDRIEKYSLAYITDTKINPVLTKLCGECEFRANQEDLNKGLKNGFKECWKQQLNWKDQDFDEPNVLDIWNFPKKDEFIKEGKIKFSQIYEDDINPNKSHQAARQWLQIEKANNNDNSIWLDKVGLKEEMDNWVFPLHFIDFETAAPAIPFNKGKSPYEGVAFQFSHHIVYEDGRAEHKGQYINTERGIFPNYEFARQLKSELDKDEGTIFRYATHENTYLNLIHQQLQSDKDPVEDKDELCDFIETITYLKENEDVIRRGERDMVDMLKVVQLHYYNPMTNGSNSIKQVLPATLNSSDYLKEKYSKPIYGTDRFPSKNLKNGMTWIKFEDGLVKDPYKLLKLSSGDNKDISDGGDAMTAYSRMQFSEMGDDEYNELKNGLLRYCELDTLAMVMIYEAWREWLVGQ